MARENTLSGVPWTGGPPSIEGKSKFSISNFLSEVSQGGLAKPNRFEVIFNTPICLLNDPISNVSDRVSMFCDNTILPSTRLITSRQQIFGPPTFSPVGVDYGGDNITMVFVLDSAMNIKRFFDRWMDNIVNKSAMTNAYGQRSQYTTNYKTTYATEVNISQLDERDQVTYSVRLRELFPIAINPLQLDHAQNNMVHRLSVTFNYSTWEENQITGVAAADQTAVPNLISQIGAGISPSSPVINYPGILSSAPILTPQQQAQNVLQPGSNVLPPTNPVAGSTTNNYFLVT